MSIFYLLGIAYIALERIRFPSAHFAYLRIGVSFHGIIRGSPYAERVRFVPIGIKITER